MSGGCGAGGRNEQPGTPAPPFASLRGRILTWARPGHAHPALAQVDNGPVPRGCHRALSLRLASNPRGRAKAAAARPQLTGPRGLIAALAGRGVSSSARRRCPSPNTTAMRLDYMFTVVCVPRGSPAVGTVSMPHSLVPRLMRKNPSRPQSVP